MPARSTGHASRPGLRVLRKTFWPRARAAAIRVPSRAALRLDLLGEPRWWRAVAPPVQVPLGVERHARADQLQERRLRDGLAEVGVEPIRELHPRRARLVGEPGVRGSLVPAGARVGGEADEVAVDRRHVGVLGGHGARRRDGHGRRDRADRVHGIDEPCVLEGELLGGRRVHTAGAGRGEGGERDEGRTCVAGDATRGESHRAGC